MTTPEIELFYPENRQQWRDWLTKNHAHKTAVWLVLYKKKANMPTLTWSVAVDEALCFGWIDSVQRKLDEDRSIQYFSKRKSKSTWSKINKLKVEELIAANLMTQSGLESIQIAKQNGSWQILDTVEELVLPDDLVAELSLNEMAMNFFLGLSKSTRKAMLQWLVMAKRTETRQRRIAEIVELATKKQKPKQF